MLLPVTASAEAQLTPIGTYEDWTAYELRDGELRLCYAETPLADWLAPHERLAGTVLMVSHQSMGYGGEMVRLRMGPAFFQEGFDYYEFLLGFDQQWAGYNFDFDGGELPRWSRGFGEIVEDINDAASAGQPAIFWRYPQGNSRYGEGEEHRQVAGVFSLEGFTHGYAAIREACPTPMDASSPTPVHVSDVRLEGDTPQLDDESMSDEEKDILVREWLSQGPYLEFDAIGRSFFQGQVDERLTVRAVLSRENELYELPLQTVASLAEDRAFNDILLSYATRRLNFYRNGEFFYSNETPWYSAQYNFGGVCETPEGRLHLLFSSWSGGASSGMADFAGAFDPEKGIAWQSLKGPVDVPVDYAHCAQDQQQWPWETWGGAFTPCTCGGWYAETPYTTALDAWRAEFGSVAEENPVIHDEIFSELKESFSKLGPFSSWDPRVTISLNEVESTAFDVASVRFFHLSDPFESFHSVFARRRGEDSWLRIYDADVDWQLEEVRISGFTQAHLLEWSAIASGRYEDQVIDLNQLFSEAGSVSAGDN